MKKKAKIPLPKAGNFLGVIDATGTLAPNEVFIQYKRDDFNIKNAKSDMDIIEVLSRFSNKQRP